jgi:hypothetical protein
MDINLHLTIPQFALGVIATIAVIIVGKWLLKIIFKDFEN